MLQADLRILLLGTPLVNCLLDCLHKQLAKMSKLLTYQCKNWYFFFQDVDDI